MSVVILVLLLSGLLNYIVDPAHLFSKGTYEHGIVKLLQQDKNVANISNYDERLLQKYYVDNLQKRKNILVLGSSRSLQIRSSLFKSTSFFNSSVSGASSEDYLSIFAMYYKYGFVPEEVIIGIDPWVFNKNNNQTRWWVNRYHYYSMLELIGVDAPTRNNYAALQNSKLNQLFSWGYLKESLSYLLNRRIKDEVKGRQYYPIENDTGAVTVKRIDGSLYEAFYENKTLDEIKKSVRDFSISPYSLQDFTEINMRASLEIERFIKFLVKINVEVTVFLAPYHPHVYKSLVQQGDKYKINEVESLLRVIAAKNNISVIGSYNPVESKCEENEFYDGMHPRETCVNRIFNSVL